MQRCRLLAVPRQLQQLPGQPDLHADHLVVPLQGLELGGVPAAKGRVSAGRGGSGDKMAYVPVARDAEHNEKLN